MATIPSQQDLLNTQDLTNATAVTGAQLNQILTTGTPFTDKGLILWTTDASNGTPNVPDATTYTKWQTYFWGRISNAATAIVTLYYWNPYQGSGSLQKWVPLFSGAIASGSITGAQIATGTITASNIAGLTITDALISTVGGTKIIAGTVPLSVFNVSGVSAFQMLQMNSGGTTLQWFTPTKLVTAPLDTGLAANPLAMLTVNGAGTGYQLAPHTVLQVASQTATAALGTTTVLSIGTAPTTSNTTIYTGFGTGGSIAFTPLSANSTIVIEVLLETGITSGSPVGIQAGLFNGTTLISGDAARLLDAASETFYSKLRLMASLASAGTSTLTFKIGFAALTTGGVGINESGGYGSTYRIMEYI